MFIHHFKLISTFNIYNRANFKGETCCDSGYTCKVYNEW